MSSRWRLSDVWNLATASREERPNKPRDYMWASELGKGVADVVLRMRGEEPTNPPNGRSRRKFEAGNIFEWIVRLVLLRSGILKETQERVVFKYDDLIEVSGKIDFEAGGMPKYDTALDSLGVMELPDVIKRGTVALIEYLQAKYPLGLEETLIEVKSVSAFMFEALERTGQASRNHRLQLTHYLKSKGKDFGVLVYICRDDLRMIEVEVFLDDETEAEYRKEIEEVTRVYRSGEAVPLEPLIFYDLDTERFSKNWKVAYSNYLTKLYGFKDQAEYDEIYVPLANSWNSVLNRLRKANARKQWLLTGGFTEQDVVKVKVEGKRNRQQAVMVDGQEVLLPKEYQSGYEMTVKNLESLKGIESEGYDPYELAARMKDAIPEDESANEEYLATDI